MPWPPTAVTPQNHISTRRLFLPESSVAIAYFVCEHILCVGWNLVLRQIWKDVKAPQTLATNPYSVGIVIQLSPPGGGLT